MEKSLCIINEAVQCLIKRIDPALRPSQPEALCEKARAMEFTTPLAICIRQFSDRIDAIRVSVDSALNRVEL